VPIAVDGFKEPHLLPDAELFRPMIFTVCVFTHSAGTASAIGAHLAKMAIGAGVFLRGGGCASTLRFKNLQARNCFELTPLFKVSFVHFMIPLL